MDHWFCLLFLLLGVNLGVEARREGGFEEVGKIIDDFKYIPDAYFLVGNQTGIIYAHQKGNTTINREMEIMSASKWLSGVVIMKAVEEGFLSLSDYAHKWLDFWSSLPEDPRSRITLGHLLSFTSGYPNQLNDPLCISQPMELLQCAQISYQQSSLAYPPGEVFQYGSIHLQFAGAMVEVATGKRFSNLLEQYITKPLKMNQTKFNEASGNNPALAFGIITSTSDYHLFLRAYFLDLIISPQTRKLMEQDYTPNRGFGALPGYHYGLTNWFECRMTKWEEACLEENVHGSVGAFGFYPLVDRKLDYYMLIGTDSGFPGGTTFASLLRHQIKPHLDILMA